MENQVINLQLTTQEVNLVIQALANMPYSQVFQVIQNVSKQAQDQIQPTIVGKTQ